MRPIGRAPETASLAKLFPKPGDTGGSTAHSTIGDANATEPSSNPPLVADNVPIATPIPVTPIPITPAPATPPPGPSRQEMLKSAVAEAESLESDKNWSKSLDAWLKVAKDYPESPVGRNHLETMLNHLRDRPSPISLEEFQAMRDPIFECAQLDILSAMLLIGDSLRTKEPETAARWFSVAATKGDPTGMVQYGLMLKKGQGGKPDMDKAFNWFQAANEKGDVSGKLEVATCYLNGQGVAVDETRAANMLREVADTGDTRAMDLLGYCYDHGKGMPKDYKMAVDLYKRAADKGVFEAMGNLGIHYLTGQGVTPSPSTAAQLFEKGAKAGNPLCMGLYGMALDQGLGVSPNKMLAKDYYKKAAAAGIPNAIQWCNEHKIPYGDSGN